MAMTSFSDAVVGVVRRVPYGRVTTYGAVAAILGSPRAARGVGQVLSTLPTGSSVPWWRVVNARGEISLAAYGGRTQRALLEQEGLRFRGGRVDLRTHGWDGGPGARPVDGNR